MTAKITCPCCGGEEHTPYSHYTENDDRIYCENCACVWHQDRRKPSTRSTEARLRRAFRTWQRLNDRYRGYADRYMGRFIVGSSDSPAAMAMGRCAFRIDRVETWVKGRATNWYHCPWLPLDEIKRRMQAED